MSKDELPYETMTTKEAVAKRLLREWPFALVFVCIIFMLHPMFNAGFAIIDDHEIVTILGSDGQVRSSEVFPLIAAYAFENRGRFRPGYYVLRILEAFLVGNNPPLWHANRLLLALLSALALYWAARVLLHPLSAGVVTLLFFAGAQNEIWIALGPNESYGIPLLLLGCAWIAAKLGRHHWQPTRLFPGFAFLLLAGFMKESFIPILPAALIFIYIVMPRIDPSIIPRRPLSDPRHLPLRALDLLIFFVLITGAGGQIWLTIKKLHDYGHIYAVEPSVTSFLHAIKPMLVRYSKDTLWFLPVVAAFVTLIPRNRQEWEHRDSRVNLIKMLLLLLAGGLLLLGPQWFIYGNSPWLPGRYLTPDNLFVIFSVAVGLYFMSINPIKRNHEELRGVVIGILIAVALFRVLGTHEEAYAQALSARKFQSKLGETIQLKAQHPQLPLLFCSNKVYDREPLHSVATFLAAKLRNGERPFLQTFGWEKAPASPLEEMLAKKLSEASSKGDDVFEKISNFRGSNGRCIAVLFSGLSGNCGCEYSVRALDR